MKITKSQLKQIIKEELEAVNEVEVELMTNADKFSLVAQAFAQVGLNFAPTVIAALVANAFLDLIGTPEGSLYAAAEKKAKELSNTPEEEAKKLAGLDKVKPREVEK